MKRSACVTDMDPGFECLSVKAAARILVASEGWIRAKIEDGVIPGVCDKSCQRTNYRIFKTRFAKYLGVTREELQEIVRKLYEPD